MMELHFGVAFAALVLGVVTCKQEAYRFVKDQYGVEVAQDIVHDMDQNTVTVTVSYAPELQDLRPTVNFHDFDTKYVAFKDINGGVCLVTLAPIPFPTPTLYKMKWTNITLAYTASYDSVPLSSEEVEDIAGAKIRDFCEDYTTYRMYLTSTPEGYIRKRSVGASPCWFMCTWCLVSAERPRA